MYTGRRAAALLTGCPGCACCGCICWTSGMYLRNVQQRAAADAAHSRHSILVDHHCRQGLQYRLSAVRLPVHVAMVENSGVATQPDGGELLDIGWDLVDADLGNTRPRRGLRGLLLKVVDQSLAVAC